MVVLARKARDREKSLVCRVPRVDQPAAGVATAVMLPVVGPVVASCNATGLANTMNPGRHGDPEYVSSTCSSGIDIQIYLPLLIQ